MTKEEIFEWCKKSAFEGKDFLFLKKEVDQLDLPEEEKIQIMVKADEYLAHYQLALQERDKALQQMLMGFVLMLIGAGMNLYVYVTASKHSYLLDGLIIAGVFIFREAYTTYQTPLEDFDGPLDKVSRKIQR